MGHLPCHAPASRLSPIAFRSETIARIEQVRRYRARWILSADKAAHPVPRRLHLEALEQRHLLAITVTADSYNVLHDQPLFGSSVLVNDYDLYCSMLEAALVSGPTHGMLNLYSDGTFTYTPDLHFSGTDSFRYAASNGSETEEAIATISVNNVSPVANDGSTNVLHDQALMGYLSAYDSDGDMPVYSLVSGPSSGTLNLDSSGSFTFTPAVHFKGPVTFEFAASDGIASDTATFTINVTNTAPVAVDGSVTYQSNQPLWSYASAYDADGDMPTYTVFSGPSFGSVTMDGMGSFSYTPETGYNGSDSFVFEASDGVDSALGIIVLEGGNLPPVALDDSAEVADDEILEGSVSAVDPDSDPLTFSLTVSPEFGEVELNSDGTFTYTPFPGSAEIDSFGFEASDGVLSDAGTFFVFQLAGRFREYKAPKVTVKETLHVDVSGLNASDRAAFAAGAETRLKDAFGWDTFSKKELSNAIEFGEGTAGLAGALSG